MVVVGAVELLTVGVPVVSSPEGLSVVGLMVLLPVGDGEAAVVTTTVAAALSFSTPAVRVTPRRILLISILFVLRSSPSIVAIRLGSSTNLYVTAPVQRAVGKAKSILHPAPISLHTGHN